MSNINGYTFSVCRIVDGEQKFLSSVFIDLLDIPTLQSKMPELAELVWTKAKEKEQYLLDVQCNDSNQEDQSTQ